MKNTVLFILISLISFSQARAYSIIERYSLMRDKGRNDDLYRAWEHDFLLDINARMTDGAIGAVGDLADAGEVSGTTAEQITQVTEQLQKINDEEHFANVRIALGIPLPSFKIGGWGVVPDLRASYEVGAAFSITDRDGQFDLSQAGLTLPTGFSAPTIGNPALQAFVMENIKVGGNLELEVSKNYILEGFLYYLSRWDRFEYINAQQVALEDKVIDLDKTKNTQTSVALDLKFGYKDETDKWKIYAGVEEAKLAGLSDKKSTAGDLIYGYDPLWRIHGEYSFTVAEFLKLRPFAGVHYRDSYDLGDGVYGGVEFSAGWFPLSGVAMIDTHYLTLHPRLRVWFFELEYASKIPIKTKEDGFDIALIHNVNIRFAF